MCLWGLIRWMLSAAIYLPRTRIWRSWMRLRDNKFNAVKLGAIKDAVFQNAIADPLFNQPDCAGIKLDGRAFAWRKEPRKG